MDDDVGGVTVAVEDVLESIGLSTFCSSRRFRFNMDVRSSELRIRT